MTWYSAHSVVSIASFVNGSHVILQENIYLIEANSSEEAEELAINIAKESMIGFDGLTLDNNPAICKFEGIRKIVNISNPHPLSQDGDRPVSGSEVSYNEYKIKNIKDINNFMKGGRISSIYID